MANITTNTLKIGDNNLVLRDADAQARITTLEADTSTLKDDLLQLAERVGDIEVAVSLLGPGYSPPIDPGMEE